MAPRTTRSSTKRAFSATQSDSTKSSTEPTNKRQKSESSAKPSARVKSKSEGGKPQKPTEALKIHEENGDIFDAPPNTLIVHACNCDGSWGGGIAKAFKDRYPDAFKQYAGHCKENGTSLLASAEMIPPSSFDSAERDDEKDEKGDEADRPSLDATGDKIRQKALTQFIGCLFTSQHYGRRRDSPSRILTATKPAMQDLLKQVDRWNANAGNHEQIKDVRMCKINSGLFAVPWEDSKAVLTSIDVSGNEVKIVRVVSPGA